MADGAEQEDRTEEPTQRKLDEAIKRGDVAKSAEINTLFVLGGFTLALLPRPAQVSTSLVFNLRGFLMNAHLVPSDAGGLYAVGRHALWAGRRGGFPAAGLSSVFGALAGGSIQHRPLWTFEPLKPQFSRVSPMAGFKRMFGREAIVQFVKGLLKIAIVGAVASNVLWNERDRLEGLARMEASALLPRRSSAVHEAPRRRARDLCLPRPRRRRLPALQLDEAPAHVEDAR